MTTELERIWGKTAARSSLSLSIEDQGPQAVDLHFQINSYSSVYKDTTDAAQYLYERVSAFSERLVVNLGREAVNLRGFNIPLERYYINGGMNSINIGVFVRVPGPEGDEARAAFEQAVRDAAKTARFPKVEGHL